MFDVEVTYYKDDDGQTIARYIDDPTGLDGLVLSTYKKAPNEVWGDVRYNGEFNKAAVEMVINEFAVKREFPTLKYVKNCASVQ